MRSVCIVFVILLSLIINPTLSAQLDKELDSLKIAEAFIRSENFESAVAFYQSFLSMDPDNAELNFKLGFSLLNTPAGKQECIPYLEKAAKIYKRKRGKNSLSYIEAYFYLSRAYRAVYRFDEAMLMLAELQKNIRNRKFRQEIEMEFILCESGKVLYNQPIDVTIEAFGEPMNSIYSDHSPVVSADENVLIFTSKRPNESGGEPDMDGSSSEDIYFCEKMPDGTWSEPRSISPNINTAEHEASVALSLDGTTLLIYKSEDEGSIYTSKRFGDQWTEPIKMGETINSQARETSASLSADERYLYFTSSREGGFGGLDVYVSEIQADGSWGTPKNLGPAVNSEFDEEGPFIHPDGKTLFFSSKGHFGLGGYDIYKVTKNDFGTWSLPQNIGYPVNTIEDDIFYAPTPDGKRIYLSSYRINGLGNFDIYTITPTNDTSNGLSVLYGKVYTECSEMPKNTKISVVDLNTGVENYYTPNQYSGAFVFVAQKEKPYVVRAKVGDKLVFNDTLNLSKSAFNKIEYDSIRLDPFTNCKNGQISNVDTATRETNSINHKDRYTMTYKNLLFEYGGTSFTPNPETDSIIRFLRDNPKTKLKIKAYTDASGSALQNYTLSIKRGNAVKTYFISKGVKDSQLIVEGYGEENPIALNFKKGRAISESQTFNRRIEFEVIEQASKILELNYMPNIPKHYVNPNYKSEYQKNTSIHIETRI